ncbi:Helix-turn-helix [Priestia megaterium]|nr:Helix-turn-helix [Priestia megaterium]
MTDTFKRMEDMNKDHEILKPNSNVISQSFSVLIRTFRLRFKLTQKGLASKAGVTVKTIYRSESGSGGITDKTYQKIFNALAITPEDMVDALSKSLMQRKKI